MHILGDHVCVCVCVTLIMHEVYPDILKSLSLGFVSHSDMLLFQADVLVNSTDMQLTHENGIVSQLLLQKAGLGLTDQCQKLYPNGMCETNVAVTDAFNAENFRKIFHIVLPQTKWKEQV